jgi:Flp pilus assembly protein protease CpaA
LGPSQAIAGTRKTAAASIAILLLIVAFLQFRKREKRILLSTNPTAVMSLVIVQTQKSLRLVR